MKKTVPIIVLFCVTFSMLTLSCASVMSKKQQPQWAFLIKNQSGNEAECILINSSARRVFLSGYAVQDENTGWTMAVEKLYWFSNWQNGWTEATISAVGTIYIERDRTIDAWEVTLLDELKLEYTNNAQIRYRDTLLSGTDAQLLFERRKTRIIETVHLLSEALPKNLSEKEFYTQGGQFLFPEVYNYPKGVEKTKKGKNTHIKAEGISWDMAYTDATFPEEFKEIRNSGTLFRDWEETRALYYFLYTWEN